MGRVYRARGLDGRAAAVKVLSEQLARDPSWVQRFQNEARACAQLAHEHTVRILDFGAEDRRLWFAMELLAGRTVRQELEAGGRFTPERVRAILAQVCQSLDEAHRAGIVHRDIKPDNIFLRDGDRVKVLDFSVAKLYQQAQHGLQTAAGVVFGTPQYMSPEQGRGFPVDARSDLYSVGIVAFEMVLGRVPFHSADPEEVLAMHVQRPLPSLDGIPGDLAAIIARLLEKRPDARFQSARDLRFALAPPRAPVAVVSAPTVVVGSRTSGASPLFWAACLGGGVAAGVLGYLALSRVL